MSLHQQLASINPFLGLQHAHSSSDLPVPARSPIESTNQSRDLNLGTLHIQAHELENDSESSTSSTRSKGHDGGHPAPFSISTPTNPSHFLHSRSDGPPLSIDLGRPTTTLKTMEFLPIKTEVYEDSEPEEGREGDDSSPPSSHPVQDSSRGASPLGNPSDLNLGRETGLPNPKQGTKEASLAGDPKPTNLPSAKSTTTTTTITFGKE